MNVRAKGHRLERDRVKFWKSIGYEHAATSRAESKNADNAGIDLCNIPVIEQCKNGYERGINYMSLIKDIEGRVKKTTYNKHEIIIIHKRKHFFDAVMLKKTYLNFTSKITDKELLMLIKSAERFHKEKEYILMDILTYNTLIEKCYKTT